MAHLRKVGIVCKQPGEKQITNNLLRLKGRRNRFNTTWFKKRLAPEHRLSSLGRLCSTGDLSRPICLATPLPTSSMASRIILAAIRSTRARPPMKNKRSMRKCWASQGIHLAIRLIQKRAIGMRPTASSIKLSWKMRIPTKKLVTRQVWKKKTPVCPLVKAPHTTSVLGRAKPLAKRCLIRMRHLGPEKQLGNYA